MIINFLLSLKRNLKPILFIYILIQLIYVIFFPVEFTSDSYYYYRLAEDCIKVNSLYPAKQHLYEDFLSAPLYENLLIGVLSIYNSTRSIGFLNIFLNLLNIFFLYNITLKIFNKDNAAISVILYIFYLNNLGFVLTNYTELFFSVLIFGSIYFYLKGTMFSYIMAGIFSAASISVRPLGVALIISYLIIFLYKIIKSTEKISNLMKLLISAGSFLFFFGVLNQVYFGHFIFSSTNGAYNLIIGANDIATGGYYGKVFDKGNLGYIQDRDSKTYIEKGQIWKTRAFDWISHNTLKWISLIPLKAMYIFLWDDIAIAPLMHMHRWDLFQMVKYLIQKGSFTGIIPGSPVYLKILYSILQVIVHMYYFFILFLIISGIYLLKRKEGISSNQYLIILFSIIMLFGTILIFGNIRFKYPIFVSLLPFASYHLNLFISKKRLNNE